MVSRTVGDIGNDDNDDNQTSQLYDWGGEKAVLGKTTGSVFFWFLREEYSHGPKEFKDYGQKLRILSPF